MDWGDLGDVESGAQVVPSSNMETVTAENKISTSWHGYPQIYNIGHRNIREIFQDDVLIEEKVDGSQFSFGRFPWADSAGNIKCKSRGAILNTDFPEKMFQQAVDYVKFIGDQLHEGWTYRGEYLAKPKHNSLAYNRIPKNNIILFDINPGEETYLSYEEKLLEARRLDLEVVPMLYRGRINAPDEIVSLLERISVLGGQKIEGFVVKNYSRFTLDKKVMMGKYVSEAFKEVHNKEWKSSNPGALGVIELMVGKYKTPARWNKAIQHFKESGSLKNSPEDIGFLIQEIGADIEKECAEEIKEDLFKWGWNKIRRGVMAGFPEFYKELLMRESFTGAA